MGLVFSVLAVLTMPRSAPEAESAHPISMNPLTSEEEEVYPIEITPQSDEEGLLDEGPYPIEITPIEEDLDYQNFDDTPVLERIDPPHWFKNDSFLDLGEDLEEARENGKTGLILYFGQHNCSYCDALMRSSFERDDITAYIQKYFDVIAIDVWGQLEVTTPDGITMREKDFANQVEAFYTPFMIFYNTDGEEALRLRGYYPPYVIRAALDYVVNGSYREEEFRAFLARAKSRSDETGKTDLHNHPLFSKPPYALDRSRFPASRPLLVIFEQAECHACDIFHSDFLDNEDIQDKLRGMEVVRLDMWAETPVIAPNGERTSAHSWASELGIFYTPSLVFFDEHGNEVLRADSVVRLFLLSKMLDYVLEKGYAEVDVENFQRWVSRQLTVESIE